MWKHTYRKDLSPGGLFFVLYLAFVLGSCSGSADAPSTALAAARVPVVNREPAEPEPLAVPVVDTPTQRLFTVVGVGDMMLGTNYPSTAYLPPNGGKDLLADVRDILLGADVTFGNLEGSILDEGGTPKRCNNPDACYVFRSPEAYARNFTDAGFDLLSLANNHSGDFGPVGRQRTKACLDKQGIRYAGLAGTDEFAIYEKDGIRYGFCAFAPNSGTCDIRNIGYAKALVEKVAAQSDIVIVSFHGGAEGATHQHVPRKSETFFGENRGNVYEFSHAVVDAGADIVFGHGPHVTRAAELYKDRFIIYSMGNFCTYGRFSLSGPAGFAPIIRLSIDEQGAFVAGEAIPIYQQKTHGPKIDPQRRAVQTLIELTKADFPETSLLIHPDGKMERK